MTDLTPERLEEIAAVYAMRPEYMRGADDAVIAELLAGCKARDAEIERLEKEFEVRRNLGFREINPVSSGTM